LEIDITAVIFMIQGFFRIRLDRYYICNLIM
jgi:hypothetical protein